MSLQESERASCLYCKSLQAVHRNFLTRKNNPSQRNTILREDWLPFLSMHKKKKRKEQKEKRRKQRKRESVYAKGTSRSKREVVLRITKRTE